MADQGRSDFYVVFTMCLCALGLKTIAHKFAISNHTVLILGVHALRSYLKLTCEYEFHSLPNKKVSGAKDHGKNYIKVRPPLVRHLLHNGLLFLLKNYFFENCGTLLVAKRVFSKKTWNRCCAEGLIVLQFKRLVEPEIEEMFCSLFDSASNVQFQSEEKRKTICLNEDVYQFDLFPYTAGSRIQKGAFEEHEPLKFLKKPQFIRIC